MGLAAFLRISLCSIRPCRPSVTLIAAAVRFEALSASMAPFGFKFIAGRALIGGEQGMLLFILALPGMGVFRVSLAGRGRDHLYASGEAS